MAAPITGQFDTWLSEKLIEINPDVDLEVFISYIKGILEDSESQKDEKKESLDGILSQIVEDDLEVVSDVIITKWNETSEDSQNEEKATQLKEQADIDRHLSSLIQKQQIMQISSTKTRGLSKEERDRKAAVMAQYVQMSDEEGDGNEGDGAKSSTTDRTSTKTAFIPNTNASAIGNVEKEKREAMKVAHEKKKLKDREDREKQKQKSTDRKDAEKKRTQKGEKRR